MRPKRLEMEGFLAYRHRTEIDFEDADLFVLSGPTGAGKSSVIDAIIFALYGTIPRLEDRRVVEPVVSIRSDRARVSLTFELEGETYHVARLVERRGSGATTTEARLQKGDDVLASGPSEVGEAITDLLGLGFDHFTKAVVLPQGAFARFLLDKPGEQQALLRALLDLEVFQQVMQLANGRAAAAKARAELLAERLAKLEIPEEGQLEAARERAARLEAALVELGERMAVLAEARARVEERRQGEESMRAGLALLESVEAPSALPTWEEERAEMEAGLEGTRAELEELERQLAATDEQLAARPDLTTLRSWKEARGRLAELEAARSDLDLEGLVRVAEAAAGARDEVRHRLAALHRANLAHQVRQELKVGEACPVCLRVVEALPEPGSHQEADGLAARLAELEEEAETARDRLRGAEGELRQLELRIEEASKLLDGAPGPADLEEELAAVSALGERRAETSMKRDRVAEALHDLQVRAVAVEERAAALRRALFEARDRVASEEPPPPGEDVVAAWTELLDWRDRLVGERRALLERVQLELSGLESEVAAGERSLAEWLEELGVPSARSPETDLVLAEERARTELADLERTLEEAASLQGEMDDAEGKRRVAAALAQHLRANNFESWILEEALDVLVEGANRLLADLSSRAYSLLVQDRQFHVIDHLNAGMVRTTKGLSGGETFLVSLALALSMAEQLAELTGTTSRLGSVFLDEGFGSLDQESLDIVANVLDELAGGGRMVGLVTHVRDLADRMPVRFEVSKGVESSIVARVVG